MKDFFVSYTEADKNWAEWIAFILEEEGYTTVIQAWDFRPGNNFPLEMQRAATLAKRTIPVLSPEYLNSKMTASEWAAAFIQDPEGIERRVMPIMVRACQPQGLLPGIVQIRIMGLDEETARQKIIGGVRDGRAKPTNRPAFPGTPEAPEPKAFPGPVETARVPAGGHVRPSLIPNMKRQWTEADRRRHMKEGFSIIMQAFEDNLRQVAEQEPRLETDFSLASATDFSAEIFLDGSSKCQCRVWIKRDYGSELIAFQEGRIFGESMNEMLYAAADGEPRFQATMAMAFTESEKRLDMKNLSALDAADYLWERFVRPLSY